MTIALVGSGNVVDCDSTTNWDTATISGPTLEQDIFFQGTAAVSAKASSKAGELYYDYGSGTELDFTSGGGEYENLIGMWISVTTLASLETVANNGLSIRVYTDTSNYIDFTIAGDGAVDNFRRSLSGFVFFVLDPTLPPTSTTGTMNLGSVRYIGVHIETTTSAKSENLIIDGIIVAKGIEYYGSTTNDWLDIVNYATNYSSRAWGFIEYDDTEEIIYMKGQTWIGSSSQTSATELNDSGRKILFTHTLYYRDGSWYPMIREDYMGIYGDDAAGYATTFQDGVIVGTDEGRSGSLIMGDSRIRCAVDFSSIVHANSVVKLYGTTFEDIAGDIKFKHDADWEMFSVTWTRCAIVDPVGAMELKNITFQETVDMYDRTWAKAWEFQTPATYNDETTDINDPGTGDVQIHRGSGHTVGDIFYFGSNDRFDSIEIEVNTPDTGSPVVVWEYWNGLSWSQVTNKLDGTNAFKTKGTCKVSWDMPGSWPSNSVNGFTAYWIRCRWTTAGATTAVTADQAWANTTSSGSALLWNTNMTTSTISNIDFIACTHNLNNCHGIQHDDATTEDYASIMFTGCDDHGHFTPTSGDLTINADADSNPSAAEYEVEGTGSVTVVSMRTVDITVNDKDGSAIQYVQVMCQKDPITSYTSDTGNNTGDTDFVVNETVDTDTPQSGSVIVQPLNGTFPHRYMYASWSGKTFTLPTTITDTLEQNSLIATYYPHTNADADLALYGALQTRAGNGFQIFNREDIANVRVELKKVGNPTGDVYCKIYTVDSSGEPDQVIASDSISTATIGTSYAEKVFDFTDTLKHGTLEAYTQYVFSIEYDGGDAGNYIHLHYDTTSGAYAYGTMWIYSGSWDEYTTNDVTFEIRNADGINIWCTSTNFLTANIEEGIIIRDTTSGAYALIDEIVSADHIVISDVTGGSFSNGDTFSIHTLAKTYTDNDDIVFIPQDIQQTNASGNITWDHIYDSPQDIRIDLRKQEHGVKYRPFNSIQTIGANGLTVSFTLFEDTVS